MKYTLEKGNNIVPYGVTELIIPEGCMINVTIPETVISLYDSREYVDTSIPLPLLFVLSETKTKLFFIF